jgi:hypothetical protein
MKTKNRSKAGETSTSFKIEDVPYESKSSSLEQGKYPFNLLKVGQSFFIPKIAIKSVSPLASIAGKKLGHSFRCKSLDNGVRVYRVRSSRESSEAVAL